MLPVAIIVCRFFKEPLYVFHNLHGVFIKCLIIINIFKIYLKFGTLGKIQKDEDDYLMFKLENIFFLVFNIYRNLVEYTYVFL